MLRTGYFRYDFAARFWGQADQTGGPDACWEWQACRLPTGYGRVRWKKAPAYAHRVAWELVNGTIPGGAHVLHRCDNPPCVNPAHLFLGTAGDNAADRSAKGRNGARRRGEDHSCSRLTQVAVEAILADTRPSAAVAADYGVAATTVQAIRQGRSWRHVARKR